MTTSQSEINADSSSNQESMTVSSDADLSSKENDDSINESVPTEYRSALKKAKTYSDMMHMSKAKIYDQLVSEYGEKFSLEAADYAMDHLEADWNQNALESAKIYQDTMNMSPAAIYDQLVSDFGGKFTREQAQYAIDHLN